MTVREWTELRPRPFIGRECVDTAREELAVAISIAEQHVTARKTVTNTPGQLTKVIRTTLYLADQPLTAYQIARAVLRTHPNRWGYDTIRRACGKAGLVIVGEGLSDQNEPCQLFALVAA